MAIKGFIGDGQPGGRPKIPGQGIPASPEGILQALENSINITARATSLVNRYAQQALELQEQIESLEEAIKQEKEFNAAMDSYEQALIDVVNLVKNKMEFHENLHTTLHPEDHAFLAELKRLLPENIIKITALEHL